MMRGLSPRPRQPGISAKWDLEDDEALERIIEARAEELARHEAMRWRFRLVLVETVMMALLVLIAGLVLGQKTELVLRGAALVGAGCLATGALLIVLSAACARLLTRMRQWRNR